MQRREFIRTTAAGLAGLALPGSSIQAAQRSPVMTVTGLMDAPQLGLTLMHEHVLVDFIGADKVSRERYDAEEVFKTALPHLKQLRAAGCRTFVDCTPNFLGRDAALLQRLARASGLRIITNTGYYGARNHQFLPAHAATETPEQLAARWVKEFTHGIDGTGIKPGFIKIGVDAGPLSALNTKIVTAAALTHLQTGLTIGAHTGDGLAAMEELALLDRQGVSPQAFIWIHAHSEKNSELHIQAARRGCWIEFDGIHPRSLERHVALVKTMREANLLDRVLLSQDAGWYHVGETRGGEYRGYDFLLTGFVPALKAAGFSAAQIRQLLVSNPQQALTIRVKKMRSG
jgi:predicted metal-dependent phosphotriesterase family hydrolase